MADIFYVDSGYVQSGYAVYTADAVSTLSASATVIASPTKAKYGVATLNATASISILATLVSPASITLPSTATLSSSASRTRTVAKSLSATSTISSRGVTTKQTTKTLNAVATLSSSAKRTRRGSASLFVQSGIVTDGRAQFGGASLLASSGSLSAKANATFRIGGYDSIPNNAGAFSSHGIEISTSSYYKQTTLSAFGGGSQAYSIWAQRDDSTDTNSTLFSFVGGGDPVPGGSQGYIGRQTLRRLSNAVEFTFEFSYDDNPSVRHVSTASWAVTGSATDWHNYILRWDTFDNIGDEFYRVELYYDGVSRGVQDLAIGNVDGRVVSDQGWIGVEPTFNYTSQSWEVTTTTSILNGCAVQFATVTIITATDVTKVYNNGYVVKPTGIGTNVNYLDTSYSTGLTAYKYTGTGVGTTTATVSCGLLTDSKEIHAVATLGSLAGKVVGARATLATQASVSGTGQTVKIARSTLAVQSSMAISANVVGGGTAPLHAFASMTTKGNATFSHQRATLSATASITKATQTYAIFGTATLSSSASMRVVTSAEATLHSTSNLNVDPSFIYRGSATLNAEANIDKAIGGVYRIAQATLSTQASLSGQLTIVPIPDDLQTIFVEAENRTVDLLFETRIATVELESNLNRILQETRNIIVDFESNELREAVEPALEATTARIRRIPA